MRISENVAALQAMNQQLKATQDSAGLSQGVQKLSSGAKLGTGIGSLKNSFLDSSMVQAQQTTSQRAAEQMGVKPIYKAVIEELTTVNIDYGGPVSSVKPIYAARIRELMESDNRSVANTLSLASQQVRRANFHINFFQFENDDPKSVMNNNDRLHIDGNLDRSRMTEEPFFDPRSLMANGGRTVSTFGETTLQGDNVSVSANLNKESSIYKGKRGNAVELANTSLIPGERGNSPPATARTLDSGVGRGASLPGDTIIQGAANVLQLFR